MVEGGQVRRSRLGEAYRLRDGGEDGKVHRPGDLGHTPGDVLGGPRAADVREHDAADCELRVEPFGPNGLDCLEQVDESQGPQIVEAHRDEKHVGAGKRHDGQKAELGRAVDDDVGRGRGGFERGAQDELGRHRLGADDVGLDAELEARRDDREPGAPAGGSGMDGGVEADLRREPQDVFQPRARDLRAEDPVAGARLRVGVDQDRRPAAARQRGGEIDGERRLADAPLVIGDGGNSHTPDSTSSQHGYECRDSDHSSDSHDCHHGDRGLNS